MVALGGFARRLAVLTIVFVGVLGVLAPPLADPAGAEDRPTLRLGSTGEAVKTLEQQLTNLGYQLNNIDTTFQTDTRTAVLALQTAANITRDGIVGPNTWAALDARTTPPTTTPTPGPVEPGSSQRPTLRSGSVGDEVLKLERRLSDLGYWVAGVDRQFGPDTRQAVVALQKAAGIGRDGIVGPKTWAELDAGTRPRARTTSGRVIEVDLSRQLLMVVNDGGVIEVHSTSTGRVAGSTPVGRWTITRQIDGYRYAPLGTLYRPKYFYKGVAIHGYTNVPTSPASHGCVRVTYQAMDHIWSSGAAPLQTAVEVYR